MAGKKAFVLNNSEDSKDLTRNNHYVPQWYQKGFLSKENKLFYLNLTPDEITLPSGKIFRHNDTKIWTPAQCFYEYDLYTTFFGSFISDLVERDLFGEIDAIGAKAVKAFIDGNPSDQHDHFLDFFRYIDAQKTRTPKGLTWLKEKYAALDQLNLMAEMQAIQQLHCTIWLEGTREIVSAKNSRTKFIISDHPVTIYNYAFPPGSVECMYPRDPSIALKASQTIFALDRDHCLILTNYEFASDPKLSDPKNKRTNARNFGETLVRTNAFLRDRALDESQVCEINYVIKQGARRYIAAEEKEWLYPEKDRSIKWEDIKETLLPPANKVYEFGGEMFVGSKSGKVHYQDAFGRTSGNIDYLNKALPTKDIKPNDNCPCGQGRKYKNCCKSKDFSKRPAWNVYSIRERNLFLYEEICEILGFNDGKEWDDVRRELDDEKVKQIHLAFGSLWPTETDIISLLPKSDGKLRAIYSGVVDVRTIPQYVTTATLYFDEIIIHHPFINPKNMSAEYSPTERPSIYRQHTLKTIALLFMLHPFIAAGKVNLVPDPVIFNKHLRFEVTKTAKKRRIGLDINEQEMEKFGKILAEDQERMLYNLSPAQKRSQIIKTYPNASDEIVNGMIELMEKKRMEDPLSLLQDDLYENGGQIDISTMGPNYEMSLFLAKITGAVLITDSPTRWEEFTNGQQPHGASSQTHWQSLISTISKIDFPFVLDLHIISELWRNGKFGKMRSVWQNLYRVINSSSQLKIADSTKALEKELLDACEEAKKDLASMKAHPEMEIEKYQFEASFSPIIPTGGIADQNVLRFLLACGLDEYAKSVPLAIFLDIRNLKN